MGIALAVGAVIENAIGGSGSDQINGNSSANNIAAGLGNDTVDGGAEGKLAPPMAE